MYISTEVLSFLGGIVFTVLVIAAVAVAVNNKRKDA